MGLQLAFRIVSGAFSTLFIRLLHNLFDKEGGGARYILACRSIYPRKVNPKESEHCCCSNSTIVTGDPQKSNVYYHENRRSRVQAPSDAVALIFGLHCTCVFSYLSKPLSVSYNQCILSVCRYSLLNS